MNNKLDDVLSTIEAEFEGKIQKGSRHYLEVNIGERAKSIGLIQIGERYKSTHAIVPLKSPQKGMKVRIDGRTFVNYAEYDSGIAVPGYLARETGKKRVSS